MPVPDIDWQSLLLQDLDIAIIKATTSQFHVVPKEKHVKSMHTHILHASCNSLLLLPRTVNVHGGECDLSG